MEVMVLATRMIHYPGLVAEMIINSFFFVSFIAYTQYKDKTFTIFFK
jgi:hypothetical protein